VLNSCAARCLINATIADDGSLEGFVTNSGFFVQWCAATTLRILASARCVLSPLRLHRQATKPPSQRPNIADILGITLCVAVVLFVVMYAWQSHDTSLSHLFNNSRIVAPSRSPPAEPEIRKAIPVPQADLGADGFAAYARARLYDQILQIESPSPASTNSATSERAAATYHIANIKPGDVLNLRAGPGSNYPVVAAIPLGTRGITLSNKRTANGDTMWQEIAVNGYTGWVNEIYLEVEQQKETK
jgi:hypothetical protein